MMVGDKEYPEPPRKGTQFVNGWCDGYDGKPPVDEDWEDKEYRVGYALGEDRWNADVLAGNEIRYE